MMNHIKLGRIRDIPLGIHPSWFLIFGLVTWSLASGYFPLEYPDLSVPVYWLLGVVTSLLFFGSVLVHELAHAFVARRHNIPVEGITLFIFGGVASISDEPPSARAEFQVAIAGPLASLGLAIFFEVLFLLDQQFPLLAAPSVWLARINLMLAVFNMIPGFPLDGGRVLRAALWQWTGSFYRATQIASSAGQIVALGFNVVGIFLLFTGNLFNGLWLIFIGWFLQNAIAANLSQTGVRYLLQDAQVSQAMSPHFRQVEPLASLQRLVDEQVLGAGQNFFVVAGAEGVEGVLTLDAINSIPSRQWPFKTAAQAMLPLERFPRLAPDSGLLEALQLMDKHNMKQVLVMEGDTIAGVLTREAIMQLVQVRARMQSQAGGTA
ncbi:MAG: site-2 protease family protein [Anaerolineae bacterium]|nr:site-2 protease family protein [Anaerolineae bacterium]